MSDHGINEYVMISYALQVSVHDGRVEGMKIMQAFGDLCNLYGRSYGQSPESLTNSIFSPFRIYQHPDENLYNLGRHRCHTTSSRLQVFYISDMLYRRSVRYEDAPDEPIP